MDLLPPRAQLRPLSGIKLAALLFGLAVASACGETDQIRIITAKKIADTSRHPIGINVNYLRDSDRNRPPGSRPLVEALKEMGVKYLRYPGGEKSNYHLWSSPPYTKPAPKVFDRTVDSQEPYSLHAENAELMDFDEFMTLVRELGATPLIVVGAVPFGGLAKGPISRDTYLEAAKAWVQYANVRKNYGIKYWEIGNENWQPVKPQQEVIQAVLDFSREMKAIDSSIKIGASGNTEAYFDSLIAKTGDSLDFVSASVYPCNETTFQLYRSETFVLRPTDAVNALPALARYASDHPNKPIKIVAAEFSALDWSMKWPLTNDLGHAIVNCEIFGRLLPLKDFDFGLFWNTRWVDSRKDFTGVPRWSAFYALDAQNQLTANGRAVAIWGQNLMDEMVEVSASGKMVVFALQNSQRTALNLIVINKGESARDSVIKIESAHTFTTTEVHSLTGKNAEDPQPVWQAVAGRMPVTNNEFTITVPSTSVTVVMLR